MNVCAVTHVCQASWSPWWWVLGAQSSVPGSLGFWSSSVGRGKGNSAGPPLHPRCPEITHYRWTGRSPALRPARSQPLPAECGSSPGSVQTRVQDSAPCPSCGLTRDGCWCDCPILCHHYLELCWIRYETCIKLKIQSFAHRIRESKLKDFHFWITCYKRVFSACVCWLLTSRWCFGRCICPSQPKQRRHTAPAFGAPAPSRTAWFSRTFAFALSASYKFICLIYHHRLAQIVRKLFAWKSHLYYASFFESQRSKGTFLSNLKGLPKVCKRLGCSGSASLRGDGQCFKKSW